MTILSTFHWLLMIIKPYRRRIVLNALQINQSDIRSSYIAAYYLHEGTEVTYDLVDSFLLNKTGLTLMDNFELFFDHVCSIDVIFAARMIAINTNQLALRDIFNSLWDKYLDLEELRSEVSGRPMFAIKRPTPCELLKCEESENKDQNNNKVRV